MTDIERDSEIKKIKTAVYITEIAALVTLFVVIAVELNKK